jgi:2,3-dihydroxybenzoate-AMP ligase
MIDGETTVPTPQPKSALSGVVYFPVDKARHYATEGVWTHRTLADLVRGFCARFAERTAVIGSERSYTFAEVDALSDRYAAAFLKAGLQPLDRVMVQMGNEPEQILMLYGLWKANLVPVCTIVAYRDHEISALASKSKARGHIVQGDVEEKHGLIALAGRMRDAVDSLELILVIRGNAPEGTIDIPALAGSLDENEVADLLSSVDHDPYQVALFQLSGGSTGIPKIIPRFHSEYIYQVESWSAWSKFNADTVTFWPLPAMHNAAMACFNTPTHVAGGATVMISWSHPVEVVQAMVQNRPTVSGLALPHVIKLKESGLLDVIDFSFIEQAFSQNESVIIEKEVKIPGYHLFGMSEGLVMRTLPDHPEPVRRGMIGEPMSPFDEVRLIDPETLVDVAVGTTGEYCCRGPYTIHGYFDEPEANVEKFLPGGWLRSGDLMSATEIDGTLYYTFVGRLKDNINRLGEKIGAKDVEDVVREHPAVLDVAAVGMPDRAYGERVCVYIVPMEGATVPDVRDLGAFLRERGVAKFKWPERVERIEEFPVTKLGKVSKLLLKDDITAKLRAEHAASAHEAA